MKPPHVGYAILGGLVLLVVLTVWASLQIARALYAHGYRVGEAIAVAEYGDTVDTLLDAAQRDSSCVAWHRPREDQVTWFERARRVAPKGGHLP